MKRTILLCDQAIIKPLNDSDFETVTPIECRWQERDDLTEIVSEYKIALPAGTLTDGASVPRFLWSLIPPTGRHFAAAILHDDLYRRNCFGLVQKLVKGEWVMITPHEDILIDPRRFADELFRDVMEYFQVPAWKRAAMYRAVRWFGWKAY